MSMVTQAARKTLKLLERQLMAVNAERRSRNERELYVSIREEPEQQQQQQQQ